MSAIFALNFVSHHYHDLWNPPDYCPRCAPVYEKCKRDMVLFLREFIFTNEVTIAVEEGGACLDIHQVLRDHGQTTTILQEVISSVEHRKIRHAFVDIADREASVLLENGTIGDINELRAQPRCALRDPYIAKAAQRAFLEYDGNHLLLCANDHFQGVIRCLQDYGFLVLPKTIKGCVWYLSNDQIAMDCFGSHMEE